MVEYDDPEKGGTALVGLLAEKVTEAGKKPDDALLEAGLMTRNSLYFGGILMEGDQMIQFVDLDRLLRDLMRPAAGACFDTVFEVQPG
jgi:chemotaxis signal transduction protein